MMAALFLFFAIAMALAWRGQPRYAIVLVLINLLLCIVMLKYHATSPLNIILSQAGGGPRW